MSREAKKEVEDITRLILDATFNAGELCRHVERTGDCKHTLNGNSDKN